MFKAFTYRLLLVISIINIYGCAQNSALNEFLTVNKNYQVVIERDYLGVPHIIGERDIDAAFGFAFAQAEDNWQIIHDSIPFYRGNNASINGRDAATVDFLIQWLGIWETIEANYETDLKPETRAYIDAFVDGINYYAALHPEQTNESIFPITAKDMIAGYMLRHLLFYGFDGHVIELFESKRQRPVSNGPAGVSLAQATSQGVMINGLPIGSNAIAVSQPLTEDGATRLAINSHQPTTGPVAWYEAHIESKELSLIHI